MPLKIRRTERTLFVYILLFMWLGLVSLFVVGAVTDIKQPVLLYLVVTAGFLTCHLLLEKWKVKGDLLLFPLASMLNVAGLVIIFRLSPEFAERQFIWLLVGLAAFLLTVKRFSDYKDLEDYKYIYIFGGLLLLLSTILFGTETGGARSWLNFRLFSIQPSELVKIILVIFLAGYLEEKREVLTEGTRLVFGVPVPNLQYHQ
ncbi:MAG: FtsW/RodA/SpoVE family cell cycle protein, partial [Firmicutes bacterium]|nr:FtsW/RodA/SpoVE family cell cycle protein [Bacillota bacterium]